MSKAVIAVLGCLLSFSARAVALDAAPVLPKGYLIAEIAVNDPATYESYKKAVTPLIAQFGGRYLTRGGTSEAVEGEKVKGRVIILEFPTVAAVRSVLASDVYRPVAAIRYKSATSRVILIEGVVP